MRRLRREEGGWALVTAVLVTALMLTLGLGGYAYVDSQQGESRKQRNRESAFNLAEGALTQQLYILSQKWPSKGGTNNYSAPCSSTQANTLCPTQASVSQTFNSADYTSGSGWKLTVKDNPAPYERFWSDALLTNNTVPAYDASGDDRVWVRAQGTARGRTRAVVALVKVELLPVKFPRGPFMAGAIEFGNNSKKKVFVDAAGSSASYLRDGNTCASLQIDQQILPCNIQAAPSTNAITAEALEILRQTAKARGTHYAGCPSDPGAANPPVNGPVPVYFVESGNCSWSGNNTWNSAARPGLFVIVNGTIRFTGTPKFHGVLYAVNQQGAGATTNVVDLGGNATVYGAVMVDGNGRLSLGGAANSSRDSGLEYRDLSLSDITAYGTAGIIQNTWRELPGSVTP